MSLTKRRVAILLIAAALGACKADPEDPARLWSGQTAASPAAGASAVASSRAPAAAASRAAR